MTINLYFCAINDHFHVEYQSEKFPLIHTQYTYSYVTINDALNKKKSSFFLSIFVLLTRSLRVRTLGASVSLTVVREGCYCVRHLITYQSLPRWYYCRILFFVHDCVITSY